MGGMVGFGKRAQPKCLSLFLLSLFFLFLFVFWVWVFGINVVYVKFWGRVKRGKIKKYQNVNLPPPTKKAKAKQQRRALV